MAQHEHFLEQHNPERKDFQVDRIILFSDAVFAIAITLLIIEIKPPEIEHDFTTAMMLQQLVDLSPKFIAFLISFFVIAIYWRSHHRIFGFVSGYNAKLILINNLFLFSVVLMPFSSAYFSENFGYTIPFVFYCLNIALTGAINYYYIRYVFGSQHNFVKHKPTEGFLHLFKSRAISVPVFFVVLSILAMFGFTTSPVIILLLWPIFYFIGRYNSRKFNTPTAPKRKSKA